MAMHQNILWTTGTSDSSSDFSIMVGQLRHGRTPKQNKAREALSRSTRLAVEEPGPQWTNGTEEVHIAIIPTAHSWNFMGSKISQQSLHGQRSTIKH